MTMTVTIWWPRSGVRIYNIVTGVTSDVGVPSTRLVCSSGPYGHAQRRNKHSTIVTLGMLELSNHWVDLLQIKFIRTVLFCRCSASWSFAHQGHMGVPTDIVSTLGTLRTLDLSNHWEDSLAIKFIGTVLEHHGHLPNGVTWACPRAQ